MAKCGLCGTDVTFDMTQHYVPDFEGKKHRVCKRCLEAAKDKALKYDSVRGKIVIVEKSEIEIRKKCNVCGNIFCYNPVDIELNKRMQGTAIISALGGHYAASAVQQSNIITDFDKCPKCGSKDLKVITKEEFTMEAVGSNSQQSVTSQFSVADELKKFKELLDMGIITQDEFDEKKNELLHKSNPVIKQAAPALQVEQQPALFTQPTITTNETTEHAEYDQQATLQPENTCAKPHRGILIASVVSFALVLLSLVCAAFVSPLSIMYFMQSYTPRYLLALIVPCIGLYVSFRSSERPAIMKTAMNINIVLFAFQVVGMLVYFFGDRSVTAITPSISSLVYNYVNGAGLIVAIRSFIDMSSIITKNSPIFLISLCGIFGNLFAVSANICVVITLMRARKGSK